VKFTEAIRVAPLLSRWVLSVLSLLRLRCRPGQSRCCRIVARRVSDQTKSRCQHESIAHRSAPWVPDLLTLASSTQATSGMVIRGVPALGQAVGQGLLVDINGQTKKCEHGGFSLAAEQWRGGRGIAVGECVVEQEATTTAGKNAGPTAPRYPILRRRRTGGKRSTEEWAPVFWVWVLHPLCRLPGPASGESLPASTARWVIAEGLTLLAK